MLNLASLPLTQFSLHTQFTNTTQFTLAKTAASLSLRKKETNTKIQINILNKIPFNSTRMQL